MKRFICWWRGHDLVNPVGEWDCCRCGKQLSYDEVVNERPMWYRILDMLERPVKFFKPCRDCGKRFGKHDERVDHIPF